METGFFSLQGATKQVNTVRTLSRGQDASAGVVVPTIHEAGNSVAEDLLAELHRRFKGQIAPLVIHRDSKPREAGKLWPAHRRLRPGEHRRFALPGTGQVGSWLPTLPPRSSPDSLTRTTSTKRSPDHVAPSASRGGPIDDVALAACGSRRQPHQPRVGGQWPIDPAFGPGASAPAASPNEPSFHTAPSPSAACGDKPQSIHQAPVAGAISILPTRTKAKRSTCRPRLPMRSKMRGMGHRTSDGDEPKPITRAEDVARRGELIPFAASRWAGAQNQVQSQALAHAAIESVATSTLELDERPTPPRTSRPCPRLRQAIEAMSPITPPPSIHRIFGVRRTAAGVLFV